MKKSIIPNKALGQNFLQDVSVVDKIIEAAELSKNDNILEIGPGTGVLSKKIIELVGGIIMVEKDRRLAGNLGHDLKFPILTCQSISNELIYGFKKKSGIISGDILEINLLKLIKENSFEDYKIVANIPYYITGKLFRIVFECPYLPKLIVLMIQKEVAERICSKKGKMSKLGLLVKYFGEAEIICQVPKQSFYPVPDVDSAIIRIRTKSITKKMRADFDKLFRLIRIGFASPRKTLLNNLIAGLNIKKEMVVNILNLSQVDKGKRAENLTLNAWKKIVEFVK